MNADRPSDFVGKTSYTGSGMLFQDLIDSTNEDDDETIGALLLQLVGARRGAAGGTLATYAVLGFRI